MDNKIMTINDLIELKLKKEERQNEKMSIEIADGKALDFVKPQETVIIQLIEEISENGSFSGATRANDKLIYECCPALHSEELHRALEIKDPYDTPSALFDLSERTEIADRLTDFLGLGEKGEEIKNS